MATLALGTPVFKKASLRIVKQTANILSFIAEAQDLYLLFPPTFAFASKG